MTTEDALIPSPHAIQVLSPPRLSHVLGRGIAGTGSHGFACGVFETMMLQPGNSVP